VCDLETSRMGAPYIYDISRLRVKRQVINLRSWCISLVDSVESWNTAQFATYVRHELEKFFKASLTTAVLLPACKLRDLSFWQHCGHGIIFWVCWVSYHRRFKEMQYVPLVFGLLDTSIWSPQLPSRHDESLAQKHDITSQRTWMP